MGVGGWNARGILGLFGCFCSRLSSYYFLFYDNCCRVFFSFYLLMVAVFLHMCNKAYFFNL